jgi:hypothetical protein
MGKRDREPVDYFAAQFFQKNDDAKFFAPTVMENW